MKKRAPLKRLRGRLGPHMYQDLIDMSGNLLIPLGAQNEDLSTAGYLPDSL